MSGPQTVHVRFRVTWARTFTERHNNYSIALVGNIPELGNLDPYQGLHANQVANCYSLWETDIWVQPGTELTFYWVIIDGRSNEIVDFEKADNLKKVTIGSCNTLVSHSYNKDIVDVTESPPTRYYKDQRSNNYQSYNNPAFSQTRQHQTTNPSTSSTLYNKKKQPDTARTYTPDQRSAINKAEVLQSKEQSEIKHNKDVLNEDRAVSAVAIKRVKFKDPKSCGDQDDRNEYFDCESTFAPEKKPAIDKLKANSCTTASTYPSEMKPGFDKTKLLAIATSITSDKRPAIGKSKSHEIANTSASDTYPAISKSKSEGKTIACRSVKKPATNKMRSSAKARTCTSEEKKSEFGKFKPYEIAASLHKNLGYDRTEPDKNTSTYVSSKIKPIGAGKSEINRKKDNNPSPADEIIGDAESVRFYDCMDYRDQLTRDQFFECSVSHSPKSNTTLAADNLKTKRAAENVRFYDCIDNRNQLDRDQCFYCDSCSSARKDNTPLPVDNMKGPAIAKRVRFDDRVSYIKPDRQPDAPHPYVAWGLTDTGSMFRAALDTTDFESEQDTDNLGLPQFKSTHVAGIASACLVGYELAKFIFGR